MKKLVNVTEVENEGLIALMGENVLLVCMNYFYAGKLVGVNDEFVQLEDAQLVYVTGPWSTTTWQEAQKLPTSIWYVKTAAVESFGKSNR
mgnify:CR=1 FL=1